MRDEARQTMEVRPQTRRRAVSAFLWVLGLLFRATIDAHAAEISASPATSVLVPSQTTTLSVELTLGPGEDASAFEGVLGLVGDGTAIVALEDEDVTPGGPTWDTALGGVDGSGAFLSLTSSGNLSGERLVAQIHIEGQAPGVFELVLAPGTFVVRDLPDPPYFEEVPIETPIGTVLASVTVQDVTPVPGLGDWGGLAVVVLLATAGFESIRRRGRVVGR